MTTVLKPARISATFCADPGKFQQCAGDNGGVLGGRGAIFQVTRDHVMATMGKHLPQGIETKDYVRTFTQALVKYFRAAAQSPTDLSLPFFDSLQPSDADVTITGEGDSLTVKVGPRFEYKVLLKEGAYPTNDISNMTFRIPRE